MLSDVPSVRDHTASCLNFEETDFQVIKVPLSCFRRIEENLVHRLEFDDRGQPVNLVKEFRRSAAGHNQAKPSDLRPPQVCLRTAQHLIEKY